MLRSQLVFHAKFKTRKSELVTWNIDILGLSIEPGGLLNLTIAPSEREFGKLLEDLAEDEANIDWWYCTGESDNLDDMTAIHCSICPEALLMFRLIEGGI